MKYIALVAGLVLAGFFTGNTNKEIHEIRVSQDSNDLKDRVSQEFDITNDTYPAGLKVEFIEFENPMIINPSR